MPEFSEDDRKDIRASATAGMDQQAMASLDALLSSPEAMQEMLDLMDAAKKIHQRLLDAGLPPSGALVGVIGMAIGRLDQGGS